ncbi:FG-GAP-like repeat-containing protein [Nocardioides sp. P5_C9_2]
MPSWLLELLVALQFLSPTMPPVPDLVVPETPLVSAPPAAGPVEVYNDGFDTPYAERWAHVSSSNADRITQTTYDGRTVLEMRPEAHLGSLASVPFEVGTTYRVSATLKMPKETGVHPAFWLRTDDTQRVGEIDVVESWGGKPRCGRVLAAYYWRYSPPIGDKACLGDVYPQDMDQWHEYSVEFTYMGPGQDAAAVSPVPTRFFVDGVETWSTDHAPVAPEHVRLQVKRNCPDEEQPSCGETSSSPAMYVDQVRVEQVARQSTGTPADLVGIREPTTGGVEAHVLDAASGYAAYSNQTGLPLTEQGWSYATGDFDGDRVTDVYSVLPEGAGTAQVKVLDGSAYLHSFLTHATVLQRGTRLGRAEFVAGDYDGDGRDDLWVVDLDEDGRLAVSVLDASTGFQTELSHAATAAPSLDPDRWQVTAGDYDFDGRDDLYLVDLQSDGRTAVHVLDAKTAFTTFLAQTYTVALAVDPATWTVSAADPNGDGRDDLMLVNRAGTTTEVHALDAATGFSTYLLQTGTALGPTSDDTWTVLG